MKRLSITLVIIALFVMQYGNAWCWSEGGSWGDGDGWSENGWEGEDDEFTESSESHKETAEKNKLRKWNRTNWQGKFCSYSQEKELLDLLNQLENPSSSWKDTIGGKSEVRRKYRIARKLRNFDDCRAEDALKKLSEENACEGMSEGDLFCMKWGADPALQEIKSSADLKKLVPDTPLDEQLKIIRKYTRRPYENDFALHKIAQYLVKQSAQNPQFFVSLLVELFPRKPRTEEIARQYPQAANKGLEKIFISSDYDQVWWGINLARSLGKTEFLARVYDIAFEKKGNIDYSNRAALESLQATALGYFRAMQPESQRYYRTAQEKFGKISNYCATAAKGCKTSRMIRRYLIDLAASFPDFAVTRSIGVSTGAGGDASQGKEITAILISKNASWENDQGKPTIIITGAIHGNEWATPEVCLGIAEYLLANKDNSAPARDDKGALINKDAVFGAAATSSEAAEIIPSITSIKELLRAVQVIIIPVFNPDGYDFSHTPEGRKSYYGAGWRPNRRGHGLLDDDEICYRQDGSRYPSPPTDAEHCFLADYDDTTSGGELEEESVVVCENVDRTALILFEPSLDVGSGEMFDAIYGSTDPSRVVCASDRRRVWKDEWSSDDGNDSVSLATAKTQGYLQVSYGVDLNRNFQYKWDVVRNQKHLFIRSRTPSSRMYRGKDTISEGETSTMEKLIARKNVVALIDYHSGSTQVLYPYAYSTEDRVEGNFLGGADGKNDFEVFRQISEKIASILNRHDRSDEAIVNFTAAQNYNDVSVGSGVARDCYYQTEKIAAINIEVHDKRYTYEDEEFGKIVPEICKTNVPGAIWFLFWAAELGKR